MPVRSDDPRQPYLQLADELRERIETGDYQPGDRLPSTRQLAQDHGVAPMTVQAALRVLRTEGLVVSHQGRGVFVREHTAVDKADGVDDALREAREMLREVDKMLREANERLDRLEAHTPEPTDPGPEPGPQPGVGPEL